MLGQSAKGVRHYWEMAISGKAWVYSSAQESCMQIKTLCTDEVQKTETSKERVHKMNYYDENEEATTVLAHKKNLSLLPKAECASIHIAGNKGKLKDGSFTASAFIIMVKCNGEWRPENEWLHRAGMKTARRVYTTIKAARLAKEEIKTKWGVAVAKKAATKRTSKSEEIEVLKAQIAALKAALQAA